MKYPPSTPIPTEKTWCVGRSYKDGGLNSIWGHSDQGQVTNDDKSESVSKQ